MSVAAVDLRRVADRFFDSMPEDVALTFSERQRAAVHAVLDQRAWRKPRVNVRLSLPLLSRRYFLTMVAGIDRRSAVRRHRERALHPLRTLANLLFMGAVLALIYAIVTAAFLIQSSIVVF